MGFSTESPTSVPLMLMSDKPAGQGQSQGLLQESGALRLWTDVIAEKIREGRQGTGVPVVDTERSGCAGDSSASDIWSNRKGRG